MLVTVPCRQQYFKCIRTNLVICFLGIRNSMSKGIQENNFTFYKERIGKFGAQKCMPIIKCICGCEILVVPDLKAMDRAIKNHLAKHKKADYDLAFDSLEVFLTEQILLAASEMKSPNLR